MQLPLLFSSFGKQHTRRAPWLLGSALGLCLGALNPVAAQTLPNLTGQLMYATQTVGAVTNLVSFDEAAPAVLRSTAPITGITAGQVIVGMDVRPRTGQLYALAYDAALTTANGRLYTINPNTAVATPVGTAAMDLALGAATARIAIDFNPLVDLLRVVSTNRANYRLNPTTGTVVDADPATAGIQRDGDLNTTEIGVTAPTVSAAAYSNNFFGTGTTTLLVYDEALNQFFVQSPPNAGVLNAAGPVSGITVNRAAGVSFDINSVRSGENLAILAAATGTSTNTQLFEINIGSGAATLRGTLGNGISVSNVTFATFAVDPVFPAAPLTGQLMFAVTGGNLISFDSNSPRVIRTSTPISGLTAGQALVGTDFRPSNGQLYALGYNATLTGTDANAQLYTVNLSTGALTPVGTAVRMELGAATARIGFDFNPAVDLIRVVSTNNANLRMSPVTGAVTNTDTNLALSGAAIASAAYTNSGPGTAPATTALYRFNATNNQLLQQTPPNTGTLTAVGSAAGITVNPAANVDFDIYFDPAAAGDAQNKAFLVAAPTTATNTTNTLGSLYTVNLTTGAATLVEVIGAGMPISGVSALISGTVLSNNKASAKVSAQVEVYPNPATNMISINLPASLSKQTIEASLVNALGQSVVRRTLSARDGSSQNLSLHGVAKGVYMLQLSTSEGVVSKRLLVR